MDRATWFYIFFGAALVVVPKLIDRFLLEGRVAGGWRIALDLLAAAVLGVILFLIGRYLSVLGVATS
jgi:hypothetical protein